MRNKFTLFVASMCVSASAFAQWTKPAAPAMQKLEIGTECYLYNKEADGFLVGGNDFGTRASVSNTLGHKVTIENGTAEGSYYIANYVLSGWMAEQTGYMFIDTGLDRLFVDNTKEGKTENQYTFESQADGTYKIGLSATNTKFTPTEYPGAYLGVSPVDGPTVVSFCDPENSSGYQMEECKLSWYFVSTADYITYVASVEQYNAAVALKDVIDESKTVAGVDATAIAKAEKAYGDTNSTTEALTAAKSELSIAIKNAKYANASASSPVEVLVVNGIATDFTDGNCPGWESTTGAQNKQASNGNNALDFNVTGNHYENWNPDAFNPGKISANLENLPTGVYHLQALAFANKSGETYLFAGDNSKMVTSAKINIDEPMDLYAVVENGKLEIGLDIRTKGPNWVGIDNVQLFYLGNEADAYKALSTETIAAEPDYEEMLNDGSIYCQSSVYENYTKTKNALAAAESSSVATAALADFNKAANAMAESVAAYGAYYDKYTSADEFISSTTSQSDAVILLGDYINDDTSADGQFNGNGGAVYVLSEGLLDNAQIAKETAYLDKLLKDAMSNSMKDGDDCTKLLINPNFTTQGGWTAAQGIEWPLGHETFNVFQAWGRVCDVNQQLVALQNGIYEMNLQSVYKPDGDADVRQTYAYINDFDTKIGIPAEDELLSSAEDASTKFAEGAYPVKVYGLVTDGTMKIGIANRLRTGEQGILWAGGVTLTFRAKNADACTALLESLKPQAKEILASHVGSSEASQLSMAVEAAEGVSGDDGYDALVDLKKALDAAKQSVTLYTNLNTALENLKEAIDNNTTADKATVDKAQAVYDKALEAYNGKAYDNAAAEQAVSDVNAASVSIKMSSSTGVTEKDVTDLIINNTFDPAKGNKDEKRIDGWAVEGALNGYKSNSCSFNKGTFNLSQELSGLPKGKYKVTVNTFYRAGSYEEEEANINAGKDTHLMKFYANTSADNYVANIMNLSEGSKGVTLPEGISTKTINGIAVPDGTGASVKCYEEGLFLNELEFTVGEDGKATIGLRLDEVIGTNDYTVVGPWHLYYYGDATANEKDVTTLIVNNTFDPAKGNKDEKRIDGWAVEGALNGYKSNSCSFNKGTFNLSQELSGLPKGKYKVTVNTFYRAGSYEEEEANINAGKDTHLMKFYANTAIDNYVTSIMNLSEGSKGVTLPEGISTKTINGIAVPDGTGASVKCYEEGLFLNELEFTVGEDGKATIGLRLDEVIGTNDYTVVGPWHLYYYGDASDISESDVSTLIVNNDFDPAKGNKDEKRIDGWAVEGALNGYKKYTSSFNKGTFNLSQALSGLPEGTYKVTVHTFYRAGSYEEEEANINAGTDTHLCKLYANTASDSYEKSVVNLSEGAQGITIPEGVNTKTINGITVPDGTDASVACFNAGYYLNELPFYVGNDGKVTIGLKLDKTIGTNDYVVVGAWNLYYYGSGNNVDKIGGDATAIERNESPVEMAVPVAYYSLSGAKLAAPQQGVNIIKMSNGAVKKVLVK